MARPGMRELVIGSRGSHLARAMVAEFRARLGYRGPVRTVTVMTAGDRDRRRPLGEIAEDGAFSSALEQALLDGRVDVAVHSAKDLAAGGHPDLALAVTPPRGDVRDALCGATLETLPLGARVGTSAARRVAQLRALRPDVRTVAIRGNVPPRLARARAHGGALDAVMLAAAGLDRLGLADAATQRLPADEFLPDPGQGALAIQVRRDADDLLAAMSQAGDAVTDVAVRAERAMMHALNGGCTLPIGAHAEHMSVGLRLTGSVTSLDGREQIRVSDIAGRGEFPEELGARLADLLRARGADALLPRTKK
ncbi:hydroxymethylbilane synthase [Actinomadura luteofluorescens]|uniref:hydroxymethylbilane synthase n=1 Tax=Actinomadura luteofluorescens TaxID=46163 RepID=UPI0021640983|nr:hydroxymethylbilane synthase [Actinomadura glauciflava]MCR3738990.1 hydroxymethylbilane synthase [Actinomadura glauciflava]